MTISQIRTRINTLKRKFARELAILKLRRIAESVADNWDPEDPPEPANVIQLIVKAGFQLNTFTRLSIYLKDIRRQGDVPDPYTIVCQLLPWADCDRYRQWFRWELPTAAR